jgi:positive phototaxis protein PixI
MVNTADLRSSLLRSGDRPQQLLGDAYLKFELAPGIRAVLSMKQVQEVLSLPMHRLTPMPNLPPALLGLMNRRSRVLWVADLARMLGVGCFDAGVRQCSIMIVRGSGSTGRAMVLGLAVQQVEGTAWLKPDDIQPVPTNLATNLLAYLRGCVVHPQEVWLVLDAEAILQSSALSAA